MRTVPLNVRYLSGAEPRPEVKAAEGLAHDFSEQFAYSLDFWWVYLYYLGAVPAAVSVAVGMLSLRSAGVILLQLRRVRDS